MVMVMHKNYWNAI